MEQSKECSRCHVTKPLTDFNPRTERARGVRPRCRACEAELHRAWYQENRRKQAAGLVQIPQEKWCGRCQQTKASKEFGRSAIFPDGLNPSCRACVNAYGRRYAAEWKKANPEKVYRQHLRYVYGVSGEIYDAMVAGQNGRCAICSGQSKRLQVDHCHVSGSLRALLCARCNTQLGRLEEKIMKNPQFMRYIEAHGGASLVAHRTDQGA